MRCIILKTKERVCGASWTALEPGGILLIEEPDISRPPVKLIALLEKLALMGSHMHTAEEIRGMGDFAGITSRILLQEKNAVWISMEK